VVVLGFAVNNFALKSNPPPFSIHPSSLASPLEDNSLFETLLLAWSRVTLFDGRTDEAFNARENQHKKRA
jgi:hypothetical protein